MAIIDTIKAELKKAMLAREEVRVMALRDLIAKFTNEQVAKGFTPQDPINDDNALAVIKRAVKQRKDSIEQFTAANRADLADSEKAELTILEAFLPATMPRDEIKKIASTKMTELGITDKTKAGMFTGLLMKELKGQADGADVKAVIDELLS